MENGGLRHRPSVTQAIDVLGKVTTASPPNCTCDKCHWRHRPSQYRSLLVRADHGSLLDLHQFRGAFGTSPYTLLTAGPIGGRCAAWTRYTGEGAKTHVITCFTWISSHSFQDNLIRASDGELNSIDVAPRTSGNLLETVSSGITLMHSKHLSYKCFWLISDANATLHRYRKLMQGHQMFVQCVWKLA